MLNVEEHLPATHKAEDTDFMSLKIILPTAS